MADLRMHIHDVKAVRLGVIRTMQTDPPGERTFHVRDVTVICDDGAEVTMTMYSDDIATLAFAGTANLAPASNRFGRRQP